MICNPAPVGRGMRQRAWMDATATSSAAAGTAQRLMWRPALSAGQAGPTDDSSGTGTELSACSGGAAEFQSSLQWVLWRAQLSAMVARIHTL